MEWIADPTQRNNFKGIQPHSWWAKRVFNAYHSDLYNSLKDNFVRRYLEQIDLNSYIGTVIATTSFLVQLAFVLC
jgi:hypothetical protein